MSTNLPKAPLVPVQVIPVDVSGADAAEQAVPHEFDRIAPDIAQTVAERGIDPPETSASHQVVAAGQEDHFLSPHNPVVPPVHDGNAELVHPDVAAVPELLPVVDADDIDPLSVPMMVTYVVAVFPAGSVLVVTVVAAVVLMPEFLTGRIPVDVMMLLPRCAGNGEEQC